MADYYPLLSRALDALSDTAPDTRRTVYERARKALIGQLRSLKPPLSDADIARERRALEEAIGRVEVEHGGTAGVGAAAPTPEPVARDPVQKPPAPQAADKGQGLQTSDPEVEARSHPEPGPPGSLRISAPRRGRKSAEPSAAEAGDVESPPSAPPRDRPRIETVSPRFAGNPSHRRSMILASVVLVLVAAVAVAAWLLRDEPGDLPQSAALEAPSGAEAQGKLGDRIGGASAGASSGPAPTVASGTGTTPAFPATTSATQARPDVAIAQRAMLYEENPGDAQTPKAITGRAVWRLDAVNGGQGQPLETVVRATVDVPDAGMTLNLTLRRNLDPTLPASHTIELAFSGPGLPDRTVRDVGLLQLKNDEAVRGTPVSGLPVPVRENLFLIGLSNLKTDIDRNTDLLLHRSWIDLPLRFTSNQRGVLTFEKGVSGERVLNEAFSQWH